MARPQHRKSTLQLVHDDDYREPAAPAPAPWLSPKEAAIYTGLSVTAVYRACQLAELRHVRVNNGRVIRIRSEWADVWLLRGVKEVA